MSTNLNPGSDPGAISNLRPEPHGTNILEVFYTKLTQTLVHPFQKETVDV